MGYPQMMDEPGDLGGRPPGFRLPRSGLEAGASSYHESSLAHDLPASQRSNAMAQCIARYPFSSSERANRSRLGKPSFCRSS